ncbi:MAG: NUDIX domain-containing protein [Phycisphaera sp.]|nr:NUDIX domain-containing protein [Phycisphaera sp.]
MSDEAVQYERQDFYEQSAVAPFRVTDGRVEVLVITSLSGKKWIVPKGIVEPDLTPQQSAAQEAEEEAGVRGRVLDGELGYYEYDKWGGVCQVTVYAMRVTAELDDWLEADRRKRRWVSVDEAAVIVRPTALAKIVARVADAIEDVNR